MSPTIDMHIIADLSYSLYRCMHTCMHACIFIFAYKAARTYVHDVYFICCASMSTSMDPIVKMAENENVLAILKDFVKALRKELSNICADIEKIKGESYCGEIQVYLVKDSIKSVAESAEAFVDSVDDFYYYCKKTKFSEIKKSVAQGDMVPLKQFVALMGNYLKKIGTKYQSFCTDCTTAMRECGAAAERCCRLQAEANTKKNVSRVIGGTATTATIIGGTIASVVAGVFTLGIGTAIGLPITVVASVTAGTVTHLVAEDYAKMEDVFRSYSTKFSSLLSLAIDIKSEADSACRKVERFENNYSLLEYSNEYSYDSICDILDKLYNLSSKNRETTEECLKEMKSCKERVANC